MSDPLTLSPDSTLSPAQAAAAWLRLETLAGGVREGETRAQLMAAWRARFDAAFPAWLRADDLVRLPDWKHLGEVSPQERRRAGMVVRAWLDARQVLRGDDGSERRFAWEAGRALAAGFIDELAAHRLLADRGLSAQPQGQMPARSGPEGNSREDRTAPEISGAVRNIERAFGAGQAGQHGEELLAGIVLDLRCAQLPRTDKGNAARFRLRHGHDFCHTVGKGWLRWDGQRWKQLDEDRGLLPAEILEAVFDTVDAIQREAFAVAATGLAEDSIPEWMEEIDDPAQRAKLKVEGEAGKVPVFELPIGPDGMDGLVMTASTCRLLSLTLARFGRSSEEARRMKCIADLARRWLTEQVGIFDYDPFTINCQNGTLRLIRRIERVQGEDRVRVDVELTPHDRADRLTRIAAVPYQPDAVCPNYDSTMEWAQPKAAMRRYLHQWGGYNLTGDMGAQIFHVWWGPLAQNGKSTLLDAWADAAGDYAEAGKIETFMEAASAKSGDAATPALARLPGVRMLRTGEPPANAKFEESLINQITGQDTLQVRDNFRSFFPVKLQLKVTVACNAPPSIPNATEGIKRRVKVVPFEKTMKGAVKPDGTPLRDPNFKARLVGELPGVFARLVEGARDWLQHGFIEPDDVTQWTEEYKDDNDPLGRFLAYCVAFEGGAKSQSSRLYELFVAWAKATGGPDWTQTYFTKKMKAKGYSSKASNGMQWLGLKMVREVSDFVDGEGHVRVFSGTGDQASGVGAAPPAPNPSASPPDGDAGWLSDLPDDPDDPIPGWD